MYSGCFSACNNPVEFYESKERKPPNQLTALWDATASVMEHFNLESVCVSRKLKWRYSTVNFQSQEGVLCPNSRLPLVLSRCPRLTTGVQKFCPQNRHWQHFNTPTLKSFPTLAAHSCRSRRFPPVSLCKRRG